MPLLDIIQIERCDSLVQLVQIRDMWNHESQRIVTWSQKMNKFQERLALRILELEEIQESDMLKLEVKVPEVYPL